LLNTKWFLPQNRERVYLVGYTGARSGQQVFPIRESVGAVEGLAETRQESACITTSYRKGINYDNQLIRVPTNNSKGYDTMSPGDSLNYSNPKSKTRRGRVGKGVAQTLDTGCEQAVFNEGIRRLTPVECERLQGFPDNWTANGATELLYQTHKDIRCVGML
jgi:DNA (cytosine-5)-methyltransferase 1